MNSQSLGVGVPCCAARHPSGTTFAAGPWRSFQLPRYLPGPKLASNFGRYRRYLQPVGCWGTHRIQLLYGEFVIADRQLYAESVSQYFFTVAGLDNPFLVSILTFLVGMIAQAAACFLCEFIGRRPLLIGCVDLSGLLHLYR